MHFAGEESDMQWEHSSSCKMLWSGKKVTSRGPDERAQMHSMSYLLSTCVSTSNRELLDDGAAWVQQSNESVTGLLT